MTFVDFPFLMKTLKRSIFKKFFAQKRRFFSKVFGCFADDFFMFFLNNTDEKAMEAERTKRKVRSIQPLCKNKACQDLGYVTRGKEKRRRQVINVVARPSGAQMVE